MDYPRDNVFTFLFSTYRRTAGIAFTAILIAAIPVTIALISNQQDVRQRASESDNTQITITPFPEINSDYKMYPSSNQLDIPLSSQTGLQFSVTISREGRQVSDYDDYRFRWTTSPTGIATIYCGSDRCSTRRIILRPRAPGTTALNVEATRDGRVVARGQVTVTVGETNITTQPETPAATATPTLIPTPTSAPLVLEQRLFDFNDDGKIDELDLNILYVGFSKRTGD